MLSFGIAAFFAYFPVVLRKSYNIPPTITSLAYSVSAGVSITLYIFGAKLAAKYGSGRVYRWGLIMRLIGFAIIFIIFFLPIPKIYFALAGFVCIVIAWPLISISATDLTARLSPSGEGTAMGLFNATAGIATVAGSFFSGPLIQFGGDASLSGVAIIGISVAWIFARGLDRKEIIKGR
jgi:predicted MFS family arabinose efflux permease